ncbi:hypothetical protein J4402_02470 [Candidatus Pacearchaeota archaeon]|nr:hypothetical protein [Candidatus Pacearchaeota archaeon]
MEKKIILGIFAGILIVSLLGSVDAYWTRRTYYDDCYDFGDCEPRDYGLYVRIGQDSDYGYYDYPRYNYRYPNYYSRYYSGGRWHYGCDDDCQYRRKARTAIRDVSEEYNDWKYATYYSTTGELYGWDGEDDATSTNWRYKPAYNNLDYGDDYYAPVYDSEKGYFNWRY